MNLIIGDSHIKALGNYRNDKNNIIHFSASSIRGLLNQNSKTMAGHEITELANSSKYDKLFIMFGKVDLEWVYPYKLKEKNIDIKDFIDDTTDKYIEFINTISNNFEIIYVMGLHLPSLEEKPMLNFINCASTINNVSSKACIQSNFSKTTKIGSLKEPNRKNLNV